MAQGKEFKGRQFTAEVILGAVRWHLMVPISYRDLELMLQDREDGGGPGDRGCPLEGLRLAEMAYLSEGQIPEEVGHGAVL